MIIQTCVYEQRCEEKSEQQNKKTFKSDVHIITWQQKTYANYTEPFEHAVKCKTTIVYQNKHHSCLPDLNKA